MVGIILILILIIIICILFIPFEIKSYSGSGERKIVKRLQYLVEYNAELANQANKFDPINTSENKDIVKKLFGGSGVYAGYTNRTAGGNNIEYILKIAEMDEVSMEDFDISYKFKSEVEYKPQLCHNNGRAYNPASILAQQPMYKWLTAFLELLWQLPKDAVEDRKDKKYKCLVIQCGMPIHILLLASIFKNVRFIAYDNIDYKIEHEDYKYHNKYFDEAEAEQYIMKVDVLYMDTYAYTKPKPENREYSAYKDTLWQIDTIRKIRPTVAAMMRFRPPYQEIKIPEAYVPGPKDYKIIPGKIYIEPFRVNQSNEGRILVVPDNYFSELVPFDYTIYMDAIHQNCLRRIWCTYRPEMPESFDLETGEASAKKIYTPELISIDGFDRCYDCSRYLYGIMKHIYKFDNNNYNHRAVISFNNTVIQYFGELFFLWANGTPKVKYLNSGEHYENLDSSIFKYPHGIYRNMPRFRLHLAYNKIYEDVMYDKFIKPNMELAK
jgi:hypothetical protein